VRYIHLNPIRARIVEDVDGLASYPYSGHAALMGTTACPWQDTAFVLSLFGKDAERARIMYYDFVQKGRARGKRTDLTGGGLLRSHGGWAEIRKSPERLKADVRVLGESQFVLDVLSQAEQKLNRRYRLKTMGIDFSFVEKEVLTRCGISRDELYSGGRQKNRAAAKALLCFWSVRELGMSQTELSELLHMTQPGVAVAVARGEKLVKEKGYALIADTGQG
jgi:intracellular sulfur oxidation DsrE/DsrF family protein